MRNYIDKLKGTNIPCLVGFCRRNLINLLGGAMLEKLHTMRLLLKCNKILYIQRINNKSIIVI